MSERERVAAWLGRAEVVERIRKAQRDLAEGRGIRLPGRPGLVFAPDAAETYREIEGAALERQWSA